MNRYQAIVAAALATAFGTMAVAGCGLPADDGFDEFANDPNALDLAATSTTSTTTTVATSVPQSEPSLATTTTTAPELATETIELYYVSSRQTGRQLRRVLIEFRRDAEPIEVLNRLEAGAPEGEIGIGLQTLLPEGLTRSVVEAENSFTYDVDLDRTAWERIDQGNVRTAIAQIVLTLTRQRGIGQVRFTLDGEPLSVPLGSREQSEEGALVTFGDYESMLTELGEPETASTTIAEPTTTLAA